MLGSGVRNAFKKSTTASPDKTLINSDQDAKLAHLVSTKFDALEAMIKEIASGLKTLQNEVSAMKKQNTQ
jgi:uncharacterized protein YdcH (DUF465 family)